MNQKLMHIGHARVDRQAKQMEEIASLGVCPFCRENFEDHHAAPILWESKYWLVTHNDYPYEGADIHLLVVSQTHIETVSEISFRAAMDLARVFRWISNHFKIPGGSFLMRFGDMEYTGGTVAHLHAHLVVGGRKSDDAESLKAKVGYKHK